MAGEDPEGSFDWDGLLRDLSRQDAELALELRRRADRISSLILTSDLPDVDLEIQIRNLRDWVRRNLPDKLELFELVYVSRFRRLREQFRGG